MSVDFFELSYKKYALLGSICIAQNAFAYWWMRGHPMWLILAGAFWGVLFFTPLAIDLVPRVLAARRALRFAALQGVNYMFGMSYVRVMYSADLVWIPSEDVYAALGLPFGRAERSRLQADKRHRTIPGTGMLGISEKYLADFVSRSGSPEALRFNLWFEREVLKPIRNKVAQGLPVPEQVD